MITIPNILMAVGILFIFLSFFIKDKTKKIEKDVEDLSINIYQETNALKRRLKVVEEELLLEGPLPISNKKAAPNNAQPVVSNLNYQAKQAYTASSQPKPVNSILVSQVLELGKQGMSVSEIKKRSALSEEQIVHILKNGGI